MRHALCVILSIGFACSARAAAHSAWSTPVAWDVVSAVRTTARDALVRRGIAVVANPAGRQGTVLFRLPPASPGTHRVVHIYTVSGTHLGTVRADDGAKAEWCAQSSPGAAVSPGAYVARLEAGPASCTVGFVLSR